MMTLQMVSENEDYLHEIAEFLLKEELIANAMISSDTVVLQKELDGSISHTNQFVLKGISKSLLFRTINIRLREKFGEHIPLLYSEPIILIDSERVEDIMFRLAKV
ncbi:MAG: hypothetical protein AAF466_13295 [Bacteroidota bacterium]